MRVYTYEDSAINRLFSTVCFQEVSLVSEAEILRLLFIEAISKKI